MFGPLFRYELTRLARRGLQPKLRAAFAGLLLVVLFLSYLAAFPGVSPLRLITHIDDPLTIASASRFGERFLVTFLFAQALVAVLVTPAVAAGAIGEEKDRRSLDLLLTTSLTSWEIVAGKLAARLVFVGVLLLTGLPVVTLVIFLGGVDIGQLLAGYAIAICTICSLGAFTLWLTVVDETTGEAMLRAYFWGIGLTVLGGTCSCLLVAGLLSPVGTLIIMFEGRSVLVRPSAAPGFGMILALYAAVHSGLALMFLFGATGQLRGATASTCTLVPPVTDGGRENPQPAPPPLGTLPRISTVCLDDDPLAWKERHFGGWNPFLASPELFTTTMLAAPALLMAFLIAWMVGRDGAVVLALLTVVAGLAALVSAGFRAAGAVAGERCRGTLDPLLMLPVDRRDILTAKAAAAIRSAVPAAALAATVVVLGVVRTALTLQTVAAVLVLAGWVVAVVGFGLWLSVRCESRERAVVWLLGLALVVCVLPPLLARVLAPDAPLLAGLVGGLSPAVGMWEAAASHWRRQRDGEWSDLFGALVAAGVAAGIGLLFRWRAAREFERREA